ncbi:MAG: DUF5719 family protein [Candidatus Geothermincolia bacterium]
MQNTFRFLKTIGVLLIAVLLLSICSSAWAGGRGVLGDSGAKAKARGIVEQAAGQGGKPGGMPSWKGAGTGEPLLVHTIDGAPSEYMVPVVAGGKTISTVGIDALDGGWHWYCDYHLPKFPLVSAGEAGNAVRGMLKKRGLSASAVPAPQARMAPDKVVYWYFEPEGSGVSEAYVPAFTTRSAATNLEGRPWESEPGGRAATAATPPQVNPAPQRSGLSTPPAGAGTSGGYPPAYDITDVPYYKQLTDWWCGPASLEMIFDYFGPDIDQGEIAGVSDQGAAYGVYASELARAAQFSSQSVSIQDPALRGYTGRSIGYGMAYAFWENGSALYEKRYTDLKELVSQNIPVLALTWYSTTAHSGHFRVVKGYNDSLNALIVHDPWYEGDPSGPDVVFNQTEFVDNLWTYSDRWAMIAAPWTVNVYKPTTVLANQVFTVSADVAYRGPVSLAGQYAASNPTATLQASGFQVVGGDVNQAIAGIGASGSSGSVSWNVKALHTGKTDEIKVVGQGLINGNTRAYGAFSDWIGGTGDSAPVPGPTTRAWGHDSVGVAAPSTTWYLAEGCTNGGFETWVLVQNPDPAASAHVSLTYMTTHGKVNGPSIVIGPSSRTTFNVADVLPGEWSVSTQVTSDVGVVAERAMYAGGRKLGTDSVGVPAAGNTWYLAEGCTNGGFETWVLVQNPNGTAANVSLKYMTPSGPKTGPTVNIPANSRMTFNVADTVPGEWSVSTQVTANKPVIAERAVYGNNRTWGHDSVGATTPAANWYLAEGCTNGGFETWVLVQNPNAAAANVTLTYMTESGQVPGPTVSLPANSRKTFNVADTVPNDWSVSTKVTSNAPVIAERAVYGNNRTWGHDSVGVSTPATTWYLAEGCTNTGFESWVLVQNPNDQEAWVTITYMTPAGPVDGPSEMLPARSRKTYNVAQTVPWEWQVSTKVVASRPVIAERAMYGDTK